MYLASFYLIGIIHILSKLIHLLIWVMYSFGQTIHGQLWRSRVKANKQLPKQPKLPPSLHLYISIHDPSSGILAYYLGHDPSSEIKAYYLGRKFGGELNSKLCFLHYLMYFAF